jgi:hypothetical protein
VKPQKVPLVFKKEMNQMRKLQIQVVKPQKVPLVFKKELVQAQELQQEHLVHQQKYPPLHPEP